MVKYLRPGEDFSFPSSFGFKESAGPTPHSTRSVQDTNRSEAVSTPVGSKFVPQEGKMAKGGRIRRAEGGDVGVSEFAQNEKAQGKSINATRSDARKLQGDFRAYDPDEQKMFTDYSTGEHYRKGGRIHRAIGGVIPGQAPAPSAAPLSRPQTAAPEEGNPLAHANVSMPAADLARLAAGAVKVGAGRAIGAVAQAAQRRGAQPNPTPGAVGLSPAAASPSPPMQAGVGVPGMKKGGHLTAAARHALPKSDFALPGERYPIEDKGHARAALSRVSANGSPSEKSTVRAAVHRKFPDIGQKKG